MLLAVGRGGSSTQRRETFKPTGCGWIQLSTDCARIGALPPLLVASAQEVSPQTHPAEGICVADVLGKSFDYTGGPPLLRMVSCGTASSDGLPREQSD